jgi:hypothetical protein
MPMAPAPESWLPLARIERQLNALAVGWFIYAALAGVSMLIGLTFAHAFMSGHMGVFGPWSGRGHRFFNGPMMPLFLMRFAWVTLSLRVGLALLAGFGLMQKTYWGRWVAIVAGILAILHFPFGTAMGIWTLVVLLKAPNAAGYEALAR